MRYQPCSLLLSLVTVIGIIVKALILDWVQISSGKFGCLTKAYQNLPNLPNLQNWVGNFIRTGNLSSGNHYRKRRNTITDSLMAGWPFLVTVPIKNRVEIFDHFRNLSLIFQLHSWGCREGRQSKVLFWKKRSILPKKYSWRDSTSSTIIKTKGSWFCTLLHWHT